MLTRTSVTAVRLLLHLDREAPEEFASLKDIANKLEESPTYVAKIARHLVRAGILRAQRGKTGGVILNRASNGITLLAIVEASQGAILGDFCQETDRLSETCALHQAGAELHDAIIGVLGHWTLADFSRQPRPAREFRDKVRCLLEGGWPGVFTPVMKAQR